MTHIAGQLNDLTLQLDFVGGPSSFFLHSSHRVHKTGKPTAAGLSRPLSQASVKSERSVTPSPRKSQRFEYFALSHWTLRLCQRIKRPREGQGAAIGPDDTSDQGSATEDDDDEGHRALRRSPSSNEVPGEDSEDDDDPDSFTYAWYTVRVDANEAERFSREALLSSWTFLESKIRRAWDQGAVDVLGRKGNQTNDDTYESVKIDFTFDDTDAESGARKRQKESQVSGDIRVKKEDDDERQGSSFSIELKRCHGAEEVLQASSIAIQLMEANALLKSRTQTLREERQTHRKLLHNNRRHERFKEASSSLINPGRIKRKMEDDEGFEGDDD